MKISRDEERAAIIAYIRRREERRMTLGFLGGVVCILIGVVIGLLLSQQI